MSETETSPPAEGTACEQLEAAGFEGYWGYRTLAEAIERGLRALATAVFLAMFLGLTVAALVIAVGLSGLGEGAGELARLLRAVLR